MTDIEQFGIYRTAPFERPILFVIDFGHAGSVCIPAVPHLVRVVVERAEMLCGMGDGGLGLRERVALHSDFKDGSFVYWSCKDPDSSYSAREWITLGQWLENTEVVQPLPMAAE
ncbi:MAG: hypothetical protein ACM3TU_02780 [Bacillota bacterium]